MRDMPIRRPAAPAPKRPGGVTRAVVVAMFLCVLLGINIQLASIAESLRMQRYERPVGLIQRQRAAIDQCLALLTSKAAP